VPFEGGPDLPERRGCGCPWSQPTRQKWDTWRQMPHCALWRPSDWAFALTAIEIAAYVHDGDLRSASELRHWEQVLGMRGETCESARSKLPLRPDTIGSSSAAPRSTAKRKAPQKPNRQHQPRRMTCRETNYLTAAAREGVSRMTGMVRRPLRFSCKANT
jgi:hypothetical protein